jgi:signal transduction histidine kinase
MSVAAVGLATAVQNLAWPFLPPSPHLLFYPAILIVARFGGRGPGMLTVLLSTLAIAHWFLPPGTAHALTLRHDQVDLAIFAILGLAMTLMLTRMTDALKRARSALNETEEARRHLDNALRTRQEMLAVISHDLRNPLASIALSAAAAEGSLPPGADGARGNCGRIQRVARRMERLLQDLLDEAAFDAGAFRIVRSEADMGPLIDEVLTLFQPLADQGSILLRGHREALPRVSLDRERIARVLENLVGNAMKFVPRGGEISVSAQAADGKIVFEVHDSGSGIAPEQLPFIFDRHWRGDSKGGTGLGLYIARRIVEAHGGQIWASSHSGTTFGFSVPVPGPSGLG